jgi:SARP family transcriptional regulator, regulator of embCAB operon
LTEPQDTFADRTTSAASRTHIHWRDPDGTEHSLDLSSHHDSVTIGRRESNAIPLPWDSQASRVHAQIERIGDEWAIRDDGLSRNGTWVNGERLHGSRRLIGGDTIRVGRTLLIVKANGPLDSLLTVGTTSAGEDPNPPRARVLINLCGPLMLQIDGRRRESELSGRKGRQLFAYLVSNRHRAVRRDELAEILWPRDRPASPEEGLNVHITRLRAVLGKETIVGRSELRLELGDDVVVDVEAAEAWRLEARRHLARGEPGAAIRAARAALGVWQQDFLPEFDDDEWARDTRTELASAIPELLETEGEAALALGGTEFPLAEAAADALLALRPYRESDHRLLMRVHMARGNGAEALLVYERLRQRLMDELGVLPAAETRALYEQILAQQ